MSGSHHVRQARVPGAGHTKAAAQGEWTTALMSPALRERRAGPWRWRESNLWGSVGTGSLEALTWGNVENPDRPGGPDRPVVLTASALAQPYEL
jgi:hypothetical protein